MRSWWGILTEKWEFLREFLIFPHFSLTNLITCAKYNIVRFCSHPQFQLTNPFFLSFPTTFPRPIADLAKLRTSEEHIEEFSVLITWSSVLLSAPKCSSVLLSPHHWSSFAPSPSLSHIFAPHYSSLVLTAPQSSSVLIISLCLGTNKDVLASKRSG